MGSLDAFIKTVEILKREHVIDHLWKYGRALMQVVNQHAKAAGFKDFFMKKVFPAHQVLM